MGIMMLAYGILCIQTWKVIVSVISCFLLYLVWRYLRSLPKIKDLENRWILITGCDTGFGQALATRLDRHGCHVIATCLTAKGVTSLFHKTSPRLVSLQMDVTDSKQIEEVYQHVVSILPSGTGKKNFTAVTWFLSTFSLPIYDWSNLDVDKKF